MEISTLRDSKLKVIKEYASKSLHYIYVLKKNLPIKVQALKKEAKKVENKIPHIHIIRPLLQLLGPILLVLIIALFWKSSPQPSAQTNSHSKGKTKPISVVVAPSYSENVPVFLTALGTVTPITAVTIKTQVSGLLTDVLFEEGQMVKKGDILIKIDSRLYEAQLMQFQGQLARDMALLANAKLDLKRYKELITQDSVSKQIYDTQVHLVEQYEGTVLSDKGQVENARVNISYCTIHSPTDGRVGLNLINPGNFVQPSDPTGMVIVNQVNPISVIFTLPEDNIPLVLKGIKGKKIPTGVDTSWIVEAYDRAQNKLLATGKLATIDNQIDTTTGTVKLRADFQNEDNHLFPNQFVNVKLLVNTLSNATVVPTAAIQRGVQGTYVYLLMDNSTVKITPVTTGTTTGNITVITKGILPNQIVVTEGADKLTNGAPVVVPHEEKSEKPPAEHTP